MKVSIITATYNSAETLPDTLASLQSQTYQNIEYIVIDGASRDGTLELVRACPRLTTLISEPDKGIYDALNKGIAQATGDIIGFLHSDDILAYPEAIADIVAHFKNTDSDAVYADLVYVNRSDLKKPIRLWKSGAYQRSKLVLGWMPPHPTFYLKREHYDHFGGFDLGYKISADYESILRYLWREKLHADYLPKVLVKMRVGGISNRSISTIIRKSREDISAIRKNRLFWPLTLVCKNLIKIPQFLVKNNA